VRSIYISRSIPRNVSTSRRLGQRGEAMAKGRGRNIILIGKDGKVAIASATGELKVIESAKLIPDDITELLRKRQAIGKELTEALAKAKLPATSAIDFDVIDPSAALDKFVKKKKEEKK
jgi:hypothetical protein